MFTLGKNSFLYESFKNAIRVKDQPESGGRARPGLKGCEYCSKH